MKNSLLLLVLVLGLSATVNAQADGVKKKIDEKVSVKFPVEPQKLTKNGIDSYVLKQADSVAYGVSILDFKVLANLDSAALAPMKDQQGFADQLIKGMATQKPEYSFGEVKLGQWKTFTSYDVQAKDTTKKYNLTLKMILIGSKMYTFSCRVPEAVEAKQSETFFGSVTYNQ